MPSMRRLVEDAVVTALAPLKVAGMLKSCKAFNGRIDEDMPDPKLLTGGQWPAVLVATTMRRFHAIQVQRKRHASDLTVEVYVLSPSLRSREENVRDVVTGGSAGTFAIMEAVHDYLEGLDPQVAGVGLLEPVSEEVVIQNPDLSLWRVAYTCPVDRKRKPDVGVPSLTSIVSRLSLADFAPWANGIGDAFAVAAGLVTLVDLGAAFDPTFVGELVVIEGATTAANNGTFVVTGVPSTTSLEWLNPAAVAEPFTGIWTIKLPPVIVAQAGTP